MASDQRPLRLLSFDGGGVRGLSSLIILKHIMYVLGTKHESDAKQPLRPCELFDMIAGTSTGGLIAIMLGSLRMNVDECIDAYLALAPKIFPKKGFLSDNKLSRLFKAVRGTVRFDATTLEEEVKMLVTRHLKQDPDIVFDKIQSHGKSCRVYVLRHISIGRYSNITTALSALLVVTATHRSAFEATPANGSLVQDVQSGKPPVQHRQLRYTLILLHSAVRQ